MDAWDDELDGIEEIAPPQLGDAFVFDVAARFNEGLASNIDAIDGAFFAIVAGVVAVALFTVDKLRELAAGDERVAVALLALATLLCVIGYLTGFPWTRYGSRDGIRPSAFVPDFVEAPEEATAEAIRQLTDASEASLAVRARKRVLAVAALLLLLGAALVVAVARLRGGVL